MSWDILSQLNRTVRSPTTPTTPFVSSPYPQSPFALQSLQGSPFFPRQEQSSTLPRNLYVLNLPLDLTQYVRCWPSPHSLRIEFKNLFINYGVVEHSILLSQLDGLGRRR